MGLGSDAISLLTDLKKNNHVDGSGAVMEIGAQQLSDNFLESLGDLEQLGRLFGITAPCNLRPPIASQTIHGDLKHLSANAPSASQFWKWLGFSYASIDIDGSPGSIPLDLNYDNIPQKEHGKYQLVTNFGTTEHVVNQLNAFKIIHELTAHYGVMLHHLPAQGMFNHGLVNYNPKFFWMLARSNGYQLLHMNFLSDKSFYSLPQNIMDYVASFEPHADTRLRDYTATDCALVVALKKNFAIPFVAPIDVPTGTQINNRALEKRYWTVFTPDAFTKIER